MGGDGALPSLPSSNVEGSGEAKLRGHTATLKPTFLRARKNAVYALDSNPKISTFCAKITIALVLAK
jgi:hypothetical protein